MLYAISRQFHLSRFLSLPVHQIHRPVKNALDQRFPNFGAKGGGGNKDLFLMSKSLINFHEIVTLLLIEKTGNDENLPRI
jgi:hypothetical protein